jgi:hypothetical protein
VGPDSMPDMPAAGMMPVPPATQSAGPFPIATPSEVHASLHGAKQASSLLTRDANDYVPGYGQRVGGPQPPQTIFGPQWADGYSAFDTVAFAVYRFDLTARTGRLALNTQWTAAPGDYKLLWLGASNWQQDRWDWYSGAAAGIAQTAEGGMEHYKHPATGECYVAIVLLGQSPATLRKVWVSCSLRGDWWMAGREQRHSGLSPFSGPDSPAVKWRCALPTGAGAARPVYDANGNIYLGMNWPTTTDHMLQCLGPDGTARWQKPVEALGLRGGASSPALADDGTIYFVAGRGPLCAFTPGGALKWQFFGPEAVENDVAIGADGTIYVVGVAGAGFLDCSLHAVDPEGAQLWAATLGHGFDVTSPVVAPDGTVLVSFENMVLAFQPDGAQRWTYAAASGTYNSEIAVDANGRSYFLNTSGALLALNADGALAWSHPLLCDGVWLGDQPALGPDGSVYAVASDGWVHAIGQDGVERWTSYIAAQAGAISVDRDGVVFVNANDERTYALHTGGSLNWWFLTGGGAGQPVLAEDGSILVTGAETLYAIGPGGAVPKHSLDGYVRDGSADGVPGVELAITGTSPAITDAGGHWCRSGLADGAYIVSPARAGLRFAPQFQQVDISGADATVPSFTCSPLVPHEWPVEGRDPAHTRRSPHTGPDTPELAWSRKLMGYGLSSEPVIDCDGAIYVQVGKEGLYSISPAGETLWHYVPPSWGEFDTRTCALASDGTVYNCEAGMVLYAISPAGEYRWSRHYTASPSGAPVVSPTGLVLQGLARGEVYALNQDSTEAWFYASTTGSGCSSTVSIAADGTIYHGNQFNAIVALAPGGAEKWRFPADNGGGEYYSQSTLAIGTDGAVYFKFGMHFYALNPDGTQRWMLEFPQDNNNDFAPALGADGTIYFSIAEANSSPNNKLYAYNPDGSVKWSYSAGGCMFTTAPTVDGAGAIYIGSPGALHAVNPDGTDKWTYNTSISAVTTMSIGADGTLYVTDYEGYLYALGPGAV